MLWGPEWTLEKAYEPLKTRRYYKIYNSLREVDIPSFCEQIHSKPARRFIRKWHNIPYTESENHPLIEDLTYQLHNYCKIAPTNLLDIDDNPETIN